MNRKIASFIGLIAAAAFSTACQQMQDASTRLSKPPAPPDAAQPAVQPAAQPAVQPDSPTAPPAAAPAAVSEAAPKVQPLDLQANHPNGTVLQLKEIAFAGDHISVKLLVTNGHENSIKLNENNSEMILTDNLGNQYRLAPPPQNPEVEVPPRQTLNGTFVFLGRVAPTATALTLITNHEYGGDRDYSKDPKMTIANIPVQK